MAAVRSLQSPTFKVTGSVIHGRLYHLLDRTLADDEEEKGFWGELRADNDETWRVQFQPKDEEKALLCSENRLRLRVLLPITV